MHWSANGSAPKPPKSIKTRLQLGGRPYMTVPMYREHDFAISRPTYEWTVRAISILKKRLGVNITLHHREGQIEAGQILLFNHFARFETFIPQYLIFEQTKAFCRSIASHELFRGDTVFSKYLRGVGAVPNTFPRLLPFLAEEILRGRKVTDN